MARGPHDSTIGYRVHRGVLVALTVIVALVVGVLVVDSVPAVTQWALGSIRTLHNAWTSMHWSLL